METLMQYGRCGLLIEDNFVPVALCERLRAEVSTTPGQHRRFDAGGMVVEYDLWRGGSGLTPGDLVRRIAQRVIQHTTSVVSADGLVPDLQIDHCILSCMNVGAHHPRHADAEMATGDKWEPNHTHWRKYVSLLYLNNCDIDFVGGELYLPKLNQAIKPVIGRLVIMPCDRIWEHQVLPVISGVRLCVATWYK